MFIGIASCAMHSFWIDFPFHRPVLFAVVFMPIIFACSGASRFLFPNCPFASVRHMHRCVFGTALRIWSTCIHRCVLVSCLYPLRGAYIDRIVIGMVYFCDLSTIFAILRSILSTCCISDLVRHVLELLLPDVCHVVLSSMFALLLLQTL